MYDRRYWKEYLVWLALFLLLVCANSVLLRQLPDGSPWRLLTLLPVFVAMAAGLWIELRQFRRYDELQRRIYLEAMLVSGVATIGFCVTAMLLEQVMGWPRLSPLWTLVVLTTAFAVGLIVAYRRYR